MKNQFIKALFLSLMLNLCFTLLNASENASEIVKRSKVVEVEEFINTFFPEFMEKSHSPGVSFILVDRNGTVLSKGFGTHHYENGVPIDPDKHIFRIASITKTMTAIGALKLVNEGLLDLDKNVNEYFTKFKIPDTFDEPITAKHLLLHNSGISDSYIDLNFTDIAEYRDMGSYLSEHVPQRFFPPGKYGSYTNRAYMLLGHLIEEISGERYEDWMRDNIFLPLGMNNSGFYLTDEQRPWLAVGTRYVNGAYELISRVDTITRPSGDALSTAHDMGRYASMLLNNGVIDDKQFLATDIVELMFNECFTHHEVFSKGCLSFPTKKLADGTVSYMHSGYYGGWYSDLKFYPEHGFAYFATSNGDVNFVSDLRSEMDKIMTGISRSDSIVFDEKIDRLDEIVGNYRSQFISSTFEKMYHLIFGDEISTSEDGVTLLFKGEPFRQIESLIFKHMKYDRSLVFIEENGEIVRALTNTSWFSVHEKLPGWEQAESQKLWLKINLYLYVFLLIGMLIQLIKSQLTENKYSSVLGICLSILWLAPITILWATDTTNIMQITLGLTQPMKFVFTIVTLAVYLSIFHLLLTAYKVIIKRDFGVKAILPLLLILNNIAAIYWVNYWNIL